MNGQADDDDDDDVSTKRDGMGRGGIKGWWLELIDGWSLLVMMWWRRAKAKVEVGSSVWTPNKLCPRGRLPSEILPRGSAFPDGLPTIKLIIATWKKPLAKANDIQTQEK